MLLSNGLGSELYDFFLMNSSIFDGLFNINKNSLELDIKEKQQNELNINFQNSNSFMNKNEKENSASNDLTCKFRNLTFNFDYRMNILNFSDIIFNKWKPKIIYFSKSIIENICFSNLSQKEKYEKDKASFGNWLKDNFNYKLSNGNKLSVSSNNTGNTLTTITENLDDTMKIDSTINVQTSNSKVFSNKNNPFTFESKICKLNQDTKGMEFVSNTKSIILKLVNPVMIYKKDKKYKNEMEIDDERDQINNESITEKINFENLSLENAFLIDKKENILDKLTKEFLTNNKCKDEKNKFEDNIIKVNIEKENEKFYFQPIIEKITEDLKLNSRSESDKEKEGKENFDIENFKNFLKEYLHLNNMKIQEIKINEKSININIIREDLICSVEKEDKDINLEVRLYSAINITKKDNSEFDFEIISDNIDDSYFLNFILHNN
jgi:hypothetical protein